MRSRRPDLAPASADSAVERGRGSGPERDAAAARSGSGAGTGAAGRGGSPERDAVERGAAATADGIAGPMMGSPGFSLYYFFYLPRRAPNRLGKYGIYRDDWSEAVVVDRLGKPILTASENEFCSSGSSGRVECVDTNPVLPMLLASSHPHYDFSIKVLGAQIIIRLMDLPCH